jgi:hypothetical protein
MDEAYREHLEHEFGSQFDDIRERYASEIEDLKQDDLAYADEIEYRQKVYDAGFGDDCEAYENATALGCFVEIVKKEEESS